MPSPFKNRANRAIWLKLHRYLAFGAGIFFALLALTGSLSVYREELDELLNPHLVIEQPQGAYQSLDKIIASVKKAHPERYGSWTLEMPRTSQSMMTAWYDKPRETYFELYAPLMVSVNPYTAEVVDSRFWGQTASTWLLDLHTQLLAGQAGWRAVGVFGLLLMTSVCTGVYLWWPGVKGIRQVLKIRHQSGMMQLVFDVHRMVGLLTALPLLLLACTGFLLSYPVLLETLTGSSGMVHGETGRAITSTAIPNNHPTSLEAAEFIARGAFPRAKLRRITTPTGDTGTYLINLRQNGELGQRHPFTTVWVDRWSGHIKEVRNPDRFSYGETLSTWLWPLHTGEALGAKGRLAWFLIGLGLFFLCVTGWLRWLYRCGLIKDKAVDFSPVRKQFNRLAIMLYRFSLLAWRGGALLLRTLMPLAIQTYGILLHRFKLAFNKNGPPKS
ncbi:MAG: PepSY-associated TM helix domain-containing protein [Methylovulum sp.]|nr:PepSY-associated TM helix domain-containing protein [Methylovulum sp.]